MIFKGPFQRKPFRDSVTGFIVVRALPRQASPNRSITAPPRLDRGRKYSERLVGR